ncbi:MAG: histidine kinase [Bacteroidia bacterium]|nr:histidine kinase [Bacteroidia bacterium]
MAKHDRPIEDIMVDDRGVVYIQDFRGDVYKLNNGFFQKSSFSDRALQFLEGAGSDLYFIHFDKLLQLEDESPKLVKSFSEPLDYFSSCNGLVIAKSKNRVYQDQGDQWLNLEISVDTKPETIIGMECMNDKIYVVCKEKLISIQRDRQEVTQLPFEGIDVISYNSILLISSRNEGLWAFDGKNFKKYYVPGVEFPKRVTALKDRNHQLWLLSKEKELYLFDDTNQTLQKAAGNVNDFVVDKWNTLWTISGNKLSRKVFRHENIPPELSIRKMESNYLPVPLSTTIELSGRQNNLRVECEAFYSPDPLSLSYQMRMNDQDDWTDNGRKSVFTISDVPDGKHKLEFRAKAGDNNFSRIKSVEIVKKAPLINGLWPYIFITLAGLLLLAIILIIRNGIRSKALNAEKEKLRLKLEVLKTEQKLGQLRMNPHFLFNALNSISGLIALDRNTEARKHLNAFSQMMRTLLDHSFTEVTTLSMEIEFLDRYLEIEQMIRNNKFDYQFENHTDDDTRIPVMIIQPFVENAILHGIKYKDGSGHIDLRFQRQDRYVRVEIEDDGIGRTNAGKYKKEGHSSKAIEVIKERLEKLDKWDKQKNIVYADQYDQKGNPSGTKVILLIPIQ